MKFYAMFPISCKLVFELTSLFFVGCPMATWVDQKRDLFRVPQNLHLPSWRRRCFVKDVGLRQLKTKLVGGLEHEFSWLIYG